ncbi:MAG: hypothetical protein KJ893_09430 [Candidatus Omnitrophica bacterium]|nr:hypothetical protein [Candidatus Omnitrophota bacterium]MCG2704185.1 hypothetical protein [Candidatus Omnitrophota bacterium]
MTSLSFIFIVIAFVCLAALVSGAGYLLIMLFWKLVRDLWMRYLIFGGSGLTILYIYRNLRFVFCRSGIKLELWMSPKEIGECVANSFSFIRKELFLITNIFNKVRYSNHTVEKDEIVKAVVSYDEISKEQLGNVHGLKRFMLWLCIFSLPKINPVRRMPHVGHSSNGVKKGG